MVSIDIAVSIALPMWLDKIKTYPDVAFCAVEPAKEIDPAAIYSPYIQIIFEPSCLLVAIIRSLD